MHTPQDNDIATGPIAALRQADQVVPSSTPGSAQAAKAGHAMTPDQAETAGQIEHAYPGYHVWISDEGWWYASRVNSLARGQSQTVCGATDRELAHALSAEVPPAAAAHQDVATAP
jgi:hypothetical protein